MQQTLSNFFLHEDNTLVEQLLYEYSELSISAADEIKRLQKLLESRDKFIVDKGLWNIYVEGLEI